MKTTEVAELQRTAGEVMLRKVSHEEAKAKAEAEEAQAKADKARSEAEVAAYHAEVARAQRDATLKAIKALDLANTPPKPAGGGLS